MGLVNGKEEIFYGLLEDTLAKFKGLDYLSHGDVNAKLGYKIADCGSIGAHARSARNLNGEHLYKLL